MSDKYKIPLAYVDIQTSPARCFVEYEKFVKVPERNFIEMQKRLTALTMIQFSADELFIIASALRYGEMHRIHSTDDLLKILDKTERALHYAQYHE